MWQQGQNNDQQYQQYANAWDQGTYDQIPEHEARHNYQQFVNNAPPQQIEQVHEQYIQQMPQQQRAGLLEGLMGALSQRGIDPRQAGIQSTDPANMSGQDVARLTGYAQQQQPDILHQVFGPGGPLGSTGAKIAVAGLAALAAKHFLGSGGGLDNLGSAFGGLGGLGGGNTNNKSTAGQDFGGGNSGGGNSNDNGIL